VTSAVNVETSLIEFAVVLHGKGKEKSGQGQGIERTIGCYQQHHSFSLDTIFIVIAEYTATAQLGLVIYLPTFVPFTPPYR
jgi:hypothetical protein